MRTKVSITLIFAASFGALLCAPQDPTPKLSFDQQVKNQYHVTRVGANGVVLQAGSVLVVQQDNIKANLASDRIYWSNLYKKGGRVKQPMIMIKNGSAAVDKSTLRFLQVGERVYVTNIEMKPAEIVFSLQSCGTCNPSSVDPNDVPYRAELSFQFQKGFADPANFKDVQDTIEQVFGAAPAENPTTTSAPTSLITQPKAAAAEAPFQPIPPPPPPPDSPPASPKSISKGDTKDQVVTAFGQPERIAKIDVKEIYYYKDLKVTFVNGKVTDVQ